METSDSEYFESADEDFQSDTENPKSTKKLTKNVKSIENATKKLADVKLNNNKEIEKTRDDENNIQPSQSKSESKTATPKLNEPDSKKVEPPKPDEEDKKKEEPPKLNEDDQNLWDDSEIDWGKENEENEENMWENDEWESVEQEKSTQQEKEPPKAETSWSSWGTWGVSSIISTATSSVSTLTQNISTALETGMGVPDPEQLARINAAEKDKSQHIEPEDSQNSGFAFGNLVMGVSQLTKLVESTSTKVISGGLDTLETIGKKTMQVLQEGDPGLKKKRAFLSIDQDKPVLSQLLREAKEKAEKENKTLEEKHFKKKAKNYETLFDDHQGLVHLEALEMLSRQCDIKLQNLLESYTDEALTEMQETMDQVKELCELPDEEDEEHGSMDEITEKLESAVGEINIPISYKKLIATWNETETWLNSLKLEVVDARELHEQAIETLAQLTALAVEQFHKTGELLLIKEHRSTADEADSLVQLTTNLTALIGFVAAKFSDKLNTKASHATTKDQVNSLITNVFFEAANSSSYIQDAFQLLIPVLQVGAV